MNRIVLRSSLLALAIGAVAFTAGAQGPHGRHRLEGFGSGNPGEPGTGSFEFGGLVGGFGGRTITGKPFQATFTITRTESLPGNTITNTTTGTVARDSDGDTYRDFKLASIGPWAAANGPQEFLYLRNVSAMMQYIVNKTKGTFESFAIHPHDPAGRDEGRFRHRDHSDSDSNNVTVDDNPTAIYSDPATGTKYTVDDKKITRTIPAGAIGNANPIVIVSERWYSSDLNLVLETSHSDPRFGTSVYQLSNIGSPTVSFSLDPSWRETKRGEFHHRGPHGEGNPPPPPQN